MREPFPDGLSALTRARAIMRDLADWTALPWPQLEDVTTAEQYRYALHTFDTARMAGDREPGVVPFLDELRRRGVVTFDTEQSKSWFTADLRLSPDLADLWPLPEGVDLGLYTTPPFGAPGGEPEDTCTEEELDRMVSVLGPLTLSVIWDCAWRGLPEAKGCGVLLCLNSVWTQQIAVPSPGEFGVWISLGPRVAWTPAGQTWVRDSGLELGKPQTGW
ncbi:hypothetical protein [Streptomyces sp. NPDC101455]|uniref:hypothetical protein n=1 Tax=Streptomyces sp. NPDC101455 TaxID=3366142 RepID=UPI003816E747